MAKQVIFTINDAPGITAEEQIALTEAAIADAYQMPSEIDNPDFDPEQEESESNARMISNPETTLEHLMHQTVSYWKQHVAAYRKRLATKALEQQTDEENAALGEAIKDTIGIAVV